MTPESARIRQILSDGIKPKYVDGVWDWGTLEAERCLDALDARLETAERERIRWERAAQGQPSAWADLYGEACEELDAAKRDVADVTTANADLEARVEEAERRAEQLTQALRPFALWDFHSTQHIAGLEHDGHKLRAIHAEDIEALIEQVAVASEALASVEGADAC